MLFPLPFHLGTVLFFLLRNWNSVHFLFVLFLTSLLVVPSHPVVTLQYLHYLNLFCEWSEKSFSHVWLFVIPWTVAHQAPLSMEFSSKNTGVGSHGLLQDIFPTHGLNPNFLHCWQILYHLRHQGSFTDEPIYREEIERKIQRIVGWAQQGKERVRQTEEVALTYYIIICKIDN